MLKRILLWVLAAHVGLYRASRGRLGGRVRGMPILLLTTRGRRSGRARTLPLCYFEDGGAYVVIASFGGAADHPAWYLNLRQDPAPVVEVRGARQQVRATVATAEERRRLWERLMTLAPFYGDYASRTSREIPLVLLRPETAPTV
jgi:deazaflavin-dependent oxidoreductase (nitroreductase family)